MVALYIIPQYFLNLIEFISHPLPSTPPHISKGEQVRDMILIRLVFFFVEKTKQTKKITESKLAQYHYNVEK
jgi:hypothetical protein